MKQLLFICLLFFSAQLFASVDSLTVQTDKSTIVQKKFEKKELNRYKNSKDFNYNEEKLNTEPSFLERVFRWLGRQLLNFLEWLFGVESATGIFAFIVQILPYLILLAVVLLMIKLFLKVNSVNRDSLAKNKPIVNITEEEELIKSKDLPKLIQQAIEQKNFRLAVRFYYLMLLKQLEAKELIAWEQQKTNEDYIKEISKKNIKSAFSDLTHLYDFVWYGNFDISEIEFSKVESNFQNAAKLLNRKL
ncbi:DUF4129 domain-containing protein [Lutibacter sp. TH_r2]|uniref:DUF4129 domain-containing protein n=1 Tax=Lutibacter sp. TH_r2 TaxID=3082083 RepID=UPI002952B03F|nr:DUF4129 domain-containing protein [Lutibacter sp. TH_r2]MDV7188140.1 DUF4129 domain-containing protein [Lutibacter sp. TH_r2]